MTVKLLALDLDGTLFGDDLIVTPRTREALADAQAEGVIVAIATGRMFRAARLIAQDLGIDGPIICYQGALIQDVATEEILLHKTVPPDLTDEVVRSTAESGLHLNVYVNDRLYVEKITAHAEFYAQINMGLELYVVGDLRKWLKIQDTYGATKLVIVTDVERTDGLLLQYTGLFGSKLQVTKSHPRFIEFTNIECSKGRALAQLAAHYRIDRSEVMAIGDGHNDRDMIEWAGWGVAMQTAPQAVRDVARIVTPAMSEDGAAEAIERYVLGRLRSANS